MNASTLSFINMLEALKVMVLANLARFTVIAAFKDTFTEVTDRLTTMQALKPAAIKGTKPQTAANRALRLQLCKKTEAVAGPVSALASKIGDVALKELMNVKVYKLKDLNSGILIAACQNIYTEATTHKTAAADFGLKQTMLDELEALMTAYAAELPEVRTGQSSSNTAKLDIERLKMECRDILEDQLDPMVNTLLESDPTAVELWLANRIVVDPPSTPTQVKFKVSTLDNGVAVPVSGATITTTHKGIQYFATTDESGEALIKPLPFGKHDLKVEAPGFLPYFQKAYKMVKGKVNKVEVVLVRVVVQV